MEFPPELGEIGKGTRPGGSDGKSCHAEYDQRCRQWEERKHEKYRCVDLFDANEIIAREVSTKTSREQFGRTRTDGCPSHRRAFTFAGGFSGNETSPKYECVGDADMGRIDESSVLARLCSGVDGVEGKLESVDRCSE